MSGHCPTCTCHVRFRFIVTDRLLAEVAEAYRAGGVSAVVALTGRSASQAYRLVQRARTEGVLS